MLSGFLKTCHTLRSKFENIKKVKNIAQNYHPSSLLPENKQAAYASSLRGNEQTVKVITIFFEVLMHYIGFQIK